MNTSNSVQVTDADADNVTAVTTILAEVHSKGNSVLQEHEHEEKEKETSSRQQSNKELCEDRVKQNKKHNNEQQSSSKSQRIRDSWIESDTNISADVELPIDQQIKQGIMGFMENEIKKSDSTKHPIVTLSAYVNSMTESEENLKVAQSGSRPSSSHREKKSPSKRKKKRSSKHRLDTGSDFDITVSSLSALEKVDDYLREYNRAEEITLSGELEIEPNDLVNNNGSSKESKLKPKKRRKSRHDESKRDKNANTRDISPRVFDPETGKHIRQTSATKTNRPVLDLSSMLDDLGSDITSYNERHIDNPFSSPSPMTSPNCGTLERAFSSRPNKIYMQTGGNFRAVARDRVLGEAQKRSEESRYFRLSSLTPLDIAINTQNGWRGIAILCHGLLGGLCLMHLMAICYGDGNQIGHLSFHAAIILPYSATYYFLCTCCLVSVFDSFDFGSFTNPMNMNPNVRSGLLIILYIICMLLTLSNRKNDEMLAFQFKQSSNLTSLIENNSTLINIPPDYYIAWSNISIWRAILPVIAAMFIAVACQEDNLYKDLTNLLQFKHSLQSIGG